MNLGRKDDRWAPSFELVKLARLAPVLGDVISSWRRTSSRAEGYEVLTRPELKDMRSELHAVVYVGRELTTRRISFHLEQIRRIKVVVPDKRG